VHNNCFDDCSNDCRFSLVVLVTAGFAVGLDNYWFGRLAAWRTAGKLVGDLLENCRTGW
jgi:hypothetical protein